MCYCTLSVFRNKPLNCGWNVEIEIVSHHDSILIRKLFLFIQRQLTYLLANVIMVADLEVLHFLRFQHLRQTELMNLIFYFTRFEVRLIHEQIILTILKPAQSKDTLQTCQLIPLHFENSIVIPKYSYLTHESHQFEISITAHTYFTDSYLQILMRSRKSAKPKAWCCSTHSVSWLFHTILT